VLLVCAGIITLLVFIYKGHTHQVQFMLEVKRCLKLFLQMFCTTPV
jgi:hypothetical protein